MQVLQLLPHVAHHLAHRLRTHLIDQFGLHSLRPLVKEVASHLIIRLFGGPWTHVLLIDQTDVDQTAFAHEGRIEALADELVQLVLVLAGVLARVPEVALDLGDDGAHRGEEGGQRHLVTVSCVNRLTSFREY